jgi:hypothetical protein
MLGPNDPVGLQVPWRACSNPFQCYWKPEDSVETKKYIRKVVERYRQVTKYREIANELESALPPAGLRNVMEQSRFLNYGYRWIKETDPEAKVVLPGLLGTYGYPMSRSFDWLREMLGAGTKFDVMNYHDYNSWWTLCAHYDSVSRILGDFGKADIPIWITETSVWSENVSSITPRYSSPDEQAADVWRRITLLWGKGAECVWWHSGWSSPDLNSWGEYGIVSHAGKKKKSFYAFKMLNEKAAHFDSVKIVSVGEISENNESGGNGAWVVEFYFGDKRKWAMWSPNLIPYTLENLNARRLAITLVAPTALLNDGDSAVFFADTVTVAGTSFTQALTSIPVWVEELDTVPIASVHRAIATPALAVYPHPACHNLRIEYPAIHSIRFWDSNAKLVHRQKWNRALDSYEINIGDRPAGSYTLEINGTMYKTVVVAR